MIAIESTTARKKMSERSNCMRRSHSIARMRDQQEPEDTVPAANAASCTESGSRPVSTALQWYDLELLDWTVLRLTYGGYWPAIQCGKLLAEETWEQDQTIVPVERPAPARRIAPVRSTHTVSLHFCCLSDLSVSRGIGEQSIRGELPAVCDRAVWIGTGPRTGACLGGWSLRAYERWK